MRSSLDTILPQIHNFIRCWFVENTAPFAYNTQEININNSEICIDTMPMVGYSIMGMQFHLSCHVVDVKMFIGLLRGPES